MSRIPGWLPKGGRTEEAGSEYVFECPECGNPKFFWNLRKEQGYCFRCGFKAGSARYLMQVMGKAVPDHEKIVVPERATATTSSELIPTVGTDAELYLATRRVSPALAAEVGIRYEPSRERIHAPIWSPLQGVPKSYKSRSIIPGQKGWMSRKGDPATGYLFGKKTSYKNPVIVEGVFDVLTPGLWGSALAILGSQLSEPLKWWIGRTYAAVTLLLDPDAEEKSRKIANSLRDFGVMVTNLTGVFPEPGSCTRGELDCLKAVQTK
jgi:hypothetical protein